MRPSITLFALALAVVTVCGCGETNREAIQRLAPRFQSKREQLWTIAARLPPAGSVEQPQYPRATSPPLLFDERNRRANTEILMVEQLLDPDVELAEHQHFDALLSSTLLACLRWTGPRNPMDRLVLDHRGSLGEICEGSLGRPYLVVVRTVQFELPEALRLECFVVDLRNEQLLAVFPIAIHTRYVEADLGRGPWAAEARRTAYSAFFTHARCRIAAALGRLPGATVALEDPCEPDPMFAPSSPGAAQAR